MEERLIQDNSRDAVRHCINRLRSCSVFCTVLGLNRNGRVLKDFHWVTVCGGGLLLLLGLGEEFRA